MAADVIDLGRWQETVRQFLPRQFSGALSGGSQRELLRQAGATVLVLDDRLLELVSGQQLSFDSTDAGPESLAEAVSDLLGAELTNNSVVLLLPPHDFVATSVVMPGMNREALVSALRLQADTLLPAHTEPLTVITGPAGSDDAHAIVALWMGERRLDTLYQAFAQQGLFLTGVVPRCLALADAVGEQEILDEDPHYLTRVLVRDGVLVQWLHVSKKDLEQEIFERQWRQALASSRPDQRLVVDRETAPTSYLHVNSQSPGVVDYCFFPHGALQARSQLEKGKRITMGLLVVAGLAVLALLPFLFQTFQAYRLQAVLEDQRELSRSAREDRQVVQDFEQRWGVITNFPSQDVVQTLFALQRVLAPEQLTSLELSEGVIRIEGESAEPQAILQRLESDPMFTEVTFSRATSNARYYIDLRLSTVNFEGYLVRYFQDN